MNQEQLRETSKQVLEIFIIPIFKRLPIKKISTEERYVQALAIVHHTLFRPLVETLVSN